MLLACKIFGPAAKWLWWQKNLQHSSWVRDRHWSSSETLTQTQQQDTWPHTFQQGVKGRPQTWAFCPPLLRGSSSPSSPAGPRTCPYPTGVRYSGWWNVLPSHWLGSLPLEDGETSYFFCLNQKWNQDIQETMLHSLQLTCIIFFICQMMPSIHSTIKVLKSIYSNSLKEKGRGRFVQAWDVYLTPPPEEPVLCAVL